jgi:membrane fusion protein, multidrug efflux system
VRLDRTEIRAPFDGVVGSCSVSPGDYVTPASNITQIDDLSRLKIDFQVPERFLNKLRNGLRFTVRSRSIEASERVEGEVYFVSSVIDRATRSSEVKGLMHNPPPQLRPGMFANVELVLDVRRNVLTVPEGSILSTARGPQIIVAKSNGAETLAEFVPVTLGLRTKGWVEITPVNGELPENQNVVAAGVGSLVLFPGAKLVPRPLRKEFGTGGES